MSRAPRGPDRSDGSGAPGCASIVEAISSHLDGETHPVSHAEVQRHVTVCSGCARFQTATRSLREGCRTAAVASTPDLAPTILAAVTEDTFARQDRRTAELRWLTAIAGMVQLAFAIPALAGAVSADVHVGRDLGALQLALGVGLILAAWQPQRSAGVLPVAAVVAVAAVIGATVDIASGITTLSAELTHLTEVAGVLALWALRRRVPNGPPSIRVALSPT